MFHAIDKVTGREVAMKISSKKKMRDTPQFLDVLRKEAGLLSSLKHPSIISYVQAWETNDEFIIVQELSALLYWNPLTLAAPEEETSLTASHWRRRATCTSLARR